MGSSQSVWISLYDMQKYHKIITTNNKVYREMIFDSIPIRVDINGQHYENMKYRDVLLLDDSMLFNTRTLLPISIYNDLLKLATSD